MTEDPVIEAMCSVYQALIECDAHNTKRPMRAARAAIPIGSEWITPEGVRVMVVPVEGATWDVFERVAKKLEEKIKLEINPYPHPGDFMRDVWLITLATFRDKQP